jgi:hypothetical protein
VFKLLTPSVVVPGYLANKLYADAAGLPSGEEGEEVRKKAVANLKQATKEGALTKALTIEDAVACFELAKETDEPSAKRARRASKKKETGEPSAARRARRAREKLGIPRRAGRPKKTGQK